MLSICDTGSGWRPAWSTTRHGDDHGNRHGHVTPETDHDLGQDVLSSHRSSRFLPDQPYTRAAGRARSCRSQFLRHGGASGSRVRVVGHHDDGGTGPLIRSSSRMIRSSVRVEVPGLVGEQIRAGDEGRATPPAAAHRRRARAGTVLLAAEADQFETSGPPGGRRPGTSRSLQRERHFSYAVRLGSSRKSWRHSRSGAEPGDPPGPQRRDVLAVDDTRPLVAASRAAEA